MTYLQELLTPYLGASSAVELLASVHELVVRPWPGLMELSALELLASVHELR